MGPFLADIAKLFRVLQAQLIDRGRAHRAGLGGKFAIAQISAGRPVDDLMVVRLDLGERDAPSFRGGRLQHHPGGGAALAHRQHEVTGRARSVGVLITEFRFVAGRLRDLHPGPIGLHLVGDDQRYAGAHALPHFGAGADNSDEPVRRDRHEGARIVDRSMRHAVRAPFLVFGQCPARRQNFHREHEAAGRH